MPDDSSMNFGRLPLNSGLLSCAGGGASAAISRAAAQHRQSERRSEIMVEMHAEYKGQLSCVVRHGPSGAEITTDAPKDNHGLGRNFSPTDLLAAALGTCMLTVMGIYAQKHNWDLTGARAEIVKEAVADPVRRV